MVPRDLAEFVKDGLVKFCEIILPLQIRGEPVKIVHAEIQVCTLQLKTINKLTKRYKPMKIDVLKCAIDTRLDKPFDPWNDVYYFTRGLRKDCVYRLSLINDSQKTFKLARHMCLQRIN